LNSIANLKKERFSGVVSKAAQKKIQTIIDTWYVVKKHWQSKNDKSVKIGYSSMNLITVTLPCKQFHTDKEIKRQLLNHLIIKLTRDYNVKHYIWKAEAQNNGNLHFHMIIDQYINWKELRNVWNEITEKLGYITNFEMLHKHRNPNSTDIHKIGKVRNIVAYMAKYMSKSEGKRFDSGRVWGCSDSLRSLKPIVLCYSNKMASAVSRMEIDKSFRCKKLDYATVVYGDIIGYFKQNENEVFKEILQWIEILRLLMEGSTVGEILEEKKETTKQSKQVIITEKLVQLKINFS
jgi:hypothetical protein